MTAGHTKTCLLKIRHTVVLLYIVSGDYCRNAFCVLDQRASTSFIALVSDIKYFLYYEGKWEPVWRYMCNYYYVKAFNCRFALSCFVSCKLWSQLSHFVCFLNADTSPTYLYIAIRQYEYKIYLIHLISSYCKTTLKSMFCFNRMLEGLFVCLFV